MEEQKLREELYHMAHMATVQLKQIFDRQEPIIAWLCEPSFDNPFVLQFEIKNEQIHWYRTTWLKLEDSQQLWELKQRLHEPSLLREQGTLETQTLQPILNFLQDLALPPYLKREGWTLDGVYNTLKIGTEFEQIIYKWHYLPKKWKDLDTLLKMLFELGKTLK